MSNIPISSLPLAISLDGGEEVPIVQGGTTKRTTTGAIATTYGQLNTEIVLAGATLASPFLVGVMDSTVLFDKIVGAASYALMPLAAAMEFTSPVLFKDIKGDAATNNITVVFSGGEECDGLSSLSITNDYGWISIRPLPGGGGWYEVQ